MALSFSGSASGLSMRNRSSQIEQEDNSEAMQSQESPSLQRFLSLYWSYIKLSMTPAAIKECIPKDGLLRSNSSARGFVVLGIDLSQWSRTAQYIFCTTGVIVFLLLYGVLQEFVVMNKFKRTLGWFVTFLQLAGYALCGNIQNIIVGTNITDRRIPTHFYVVLAILQVMMQGFTNFSMQFLNYPAKTLFKSSRVIVTMLFGVILMGRRYTSRDYIVAVFILVGLSTFVAADVNATPQFDISGIVYILLALLADAAILNIQEHCLHVFDATHDELVHYSYLGASILSLFVSIFSGEFFAGIAFVQSSGSLNMFFMFSVFCSVGFLGMTCVAALTKRFGAITAAITATIRKAMTILLSYLLFPSEKVLTLGHIVGAGIFIAGLFIRAADKTGKHAVHYSEDTPTTAKSSPKRRTLHAQHSDDSNIDTSQHSHLEVIEADVDGFGCPYEIDEEDIENSGSRNRPDEIVNHLL